MTRYRWGITGACILFLAGVIVYNLHEFLAYDYLVYYAGGKSINWFLDYPSNLYDLDILRETVRAENFRYIFGDSGLWLAFTYPPFASLLFIPASFLPLRVAIGAHLVFFVPIAFYCAKVLRDYLVKRNSRLLFEKYLSPFSFIVLCAALILLSAPWRNNFLYGQINPYLLALILYDLLRPGTRIPRGVFIGIAAGIKLTPLAIGVLFLVRKEWKSIIALGASFAGTIAAGFALLPQQSLTYWGSVIWDPSRVGNPISSNSVAIQGILGRMTFQNGTVLKVLYTVTAIVLIAVVGYALRTMEQHKLYLSQISLAILLPVFISPISWFHHAVILPIFMVCAAVDFLPLAARWRSRAGRILCYLCYALSSLMLINTLLDWGKIVVRFWRRVDFYPFIGRYPGVDAHTLLLRAADEQPVMFVTSIPALALVVLVVLWAALLRRPAENMQ